VEMIDSHSLVKSSIEDFAAFLDEELDSDKNHVMCVCFLWPIQPTIWSCA